MARAAAIAEDVADVADVADAADAKNSKQSPTVVAAGEATASRRRPEVYTFASFYHPPSARRPRPTYLRWPRPMQANATDVKVSDLEMLDFDHLNDLAQYIPDQPRARAVEECWGGCLAGNMSRCAPLEIEKIPSGHFKHKLCANCQAHGFYVPLNRIRAIGPDQHNTFLNAPTLCVWSNKTHAGTVMSFRTINQTRKCQGPRLVIFKSPPPDTLEWAPFPDDMCLPGSSFVWVRLSKGTLVPDRPRVAQPSDANRLLPAACHGKEAEQPRSAAAQKRPREDHPQASSADLILRNPSSPSPPSSSMDSPAHGTEDASDPSSLRGLLSLHSRLDQEITAVLTRAQLGSAPMLDPMLEEASSQASAVAPEPPGGSSSASTAAPPSVLPFTIEQRQGLMALQASVRISLDLLTGTQCGSREATLQTGDTSIGASAEHLSSWLTSWLASNPPSPPGSSGAGSTRQSSLRGRWSSHICASHTDLLSCLRINICWPVVIGQLAQKVVRAPWLCFCVTMPMLVMALIYVFPSAISCLYWAYLWVVHLLDSPHGHPEQFHSTPSSEDKTYNAESVWRISLTTFVGALCFGVYLTLLTILRTLVRRRDGIPGSPPRDFCAVLFGSCVCLSLTQLARHEGVALGNYHTLSPTGEKRKAASAQVEVMSSQV